MEVIEVVEDESVESLVGVMGRVEGIESDVAVTSDVPEGTDLIEKVSVSVTNDESVVVVTPDAVMGKELLVGVLE